MCVRVAWGKGATSPLPCALVSINASPQVLAERKKAIEENAPDVDLRVYIIRFHFVFAAVFAVVVAFTCVDVPVVALFLLGCNFVPEPSLHP